MPEDSNPGFADSDKELKFAYFSLPIALNYQRNSYKLWESALKTYMNDEIKVVFDIKTVSKLPENEIRQYLLKYKLALQPNKHIVTWQKISRTVEENWGSFSEMMEATNYDFFELKKIVQTNFKKGFPYLSGAKIFNYWSFISNYYCQANLTNSKYIDIAPDTHVTKCSALLSAISEQEAEVLSKEEISERWRNILEGSDINSIDMHLPLWF